MTDSAFDHISPCDSLIHSLLGERDLVSLWKVDLDPGGERVEGLGRSLSPDEDARADRFHSPLDRRRFTVARGSLRAVLSQHLHVPADQIRFAYTPDRKPVLAYPVLPPESALCFNVSHSDALALVAVAHGRAVGIDLERLRTDFNPDALARRFFSPAEYAALSRMPAQERHRDFLSYWVCKEAYLKAIGVGLRRPLGGFTVSLEDHTVTPVGSTGEGEALAPYHLRSFSPAPGYVAAIAIEVR